MEEEFEDFDDFEGFDDELSSDSEPEVIKVDIKKGSSNKLQYVLLGIIGIVIVIVVALGYNMINNALEQNQLNAARNIKPQSAKSLIGSYVVRIYPTESGSKNFMNEPIKIIAATDKMINYINADGESDILYEEYCDTSWMRLDDYEKLKLLEEEENQKFKSKTSE